VRLRLAWIRRRCSRFVIGRDLEPDPVLAHVQWNIGRRVLALGSDRECCARGAGPFRVFRSSGRWRGKKPGAICKGAGRAEIPQVRYGRRSLSAIDDYEDVNGAVIGVVEKARAIPQRVVYRHDNGTQYN
jgi:hypothetical protein